MAVKHYVLLSTDGFIDVSTEFDLCSPRRRSVYVWGYVGGLLEIDGIPVPENSYLDYRNPRNWDEILSQKGTATIPSPIIYGDVGDEIYVTMINIGYKELPDTIDGHTIHLHGTQVPTTEDGFPESSFTIPLWAPDGSGKYSKPPTGTYLFKPTQPGTYMYHCHVGSDLHIQMGMYGAMHIYPSMDSLSEGGVTQDNETGQWLFNGQVQNHIPKTATNRNFAYNDIHSYFDKEYIMFLSDIDYNWHQSTLYGTPYNPVDYKPTYWLMNGRTYPDTLLPCEKEPGSDISYNSYVHVSAGERFLLRMANLAYQVNPIHVHGFHYFIAGEDAELSPFLKIATQNNDPSLNLAQRGFTISVAAGQSRDIIIDTRDISSRYREYILNGSHGIASKCEQMNYIYQVDQSDIAPVPTEPVLCPDPHITSSIDICNESPMNPGRNFFPQFYPIHNHNTYENTDYGRSPGGQITYYQIDPPDTVLPLQYPWDNKKE